MYKTSWTFCIYLQNLFTMYFEYFVQCVRKLTSQPSKTICPRSYNTKCVKISWTYSKKTHRKKIACARFPCRIRVYKEKGIPIHLTKVCENAYKTVLMIQSNAVKRSY